MIASSTPSEKCIGRILLSEDAILQRVQELGRQISDDYRGRNLVIVCILKGAVIFLADLLRNFDISTSLEFVQVSSYGNGTESSGNIELLRDLTASIEGKDVLIVDDIVDTGLTLYRLKEDLLSRCPASLKICVLLDKPGRRTENIKLDYVGFQIPNEFVVGYGMDFKEQYRGLGYIATLKL